MGEESKAPGQGLEAGGEGRDPHAAKRASRRARWDIRRGKMKWFAGGLVLGAAAVALGGIAAFGLETFFPKEDAGATIDVYEMQRELESSSDLTVTKVRYANLACFNNPKKFQILDSTFPVPFTDNTILIAYKGTIGLGFDVRGVQIEQGQDEGTIVVTLPEIGIQYNELNNSETKSYVINDNVFNPVDFDQSNSYLASLKLNEEQLTLSNQEELDRARADAEEAVAAFVKKFDNAGDCQVVFK